MRNRDDDQLLATNAIKNAVGPIAHRATSYPAADWLAYLLELKEERELAFYSLGKQLAVPVSLLVVVIARLDQLATSLITDDENACHTSHEVR